MSEKINIQEALDELGFDLEDYFELLPSLESNYQENIEKLKTAVETKDANLCASSAHSIKGSMKNFRFKETADIAAQLEQLGKSSNLDQAPELLRKLSESAASSFEEARNYQGNT